MASRKTALGAPAAVPPLTGAHMSVAGGLHRAFERGRSIGCGAIQIFTRSSRAWTTRPLEQSEIEEFRAAMGREMKKLTASHASYLINLGAPPGPVADRSLEALRDEVERCEALGVPYLVLHPGAHMGAGDEVGLARIAAGLDKLHAACKGYRTSVLLENAAGQGSCVGHLFEHLGRVLDSVSESHRLGVCLDTCHAFAAGYDLRDAGGYEEMVAALDRHVGLPRLKFIHLNDSKKGLGCRVDRHEHIGKGCIGLEGFRNVMNDSRLASVPKVLETPKGPDMAEDVENLAVLASLTGRPGVKRGAAKSRR